MIGPPGLRIFPVQGTMKDYAILSGLRIDRIHLNLGIDRTGYQVTDSPLKIRRRHRASFYDTEITEIESLHMFHPLSFVLFSLLRVYPSLAWEMCLLGTAFWKTDYSLVNCLFPVQRSSTELGHTWKADSSGQGPFPRPLTGYEPNPVFLRLPSFHRHKISIHEGKSLFSNAEKCRLPPAPGPTLIHQDS
jgi:hypothetical protein